MTPTLIVLVLLVVAVGLVVWFTRRKRTPPPVLPGDQDTAWNDPVAPAESPPKEPHP